MTPTDAPRAAVRATDHPVYPWLMGASLGLSAAGLYYLAGYFWGWPWGIEPALSLWLTVFGGYPFLYHLPALAGAFMRGLLARDDDRREDVEPEPEPRQQSTLVGGYILGPWLQYHYDGLLLYFQHAAAAGKLTSTALIPAAFTDPAHWKYWSDIAAANRLVDKANGIETVMPPGRDYTWAIKRLRAGDFDVPEGDGGPAPQAQPHPFSVGLRYKVELGKAGKGGPKADEDN